MATSSPHIASLLSSSSSSSFISNSYLSLRTRSLPSLTPISHSLIQNKKSIVFRDHSILLSRKSKRLDPILAAAEDVAVSSSDAAAVDAAQELVVSNTDDGVSTIIQVLLFVAFLGLSILTIGVIYLGVTDFLQKREKDKFEKEEAAKKSGKKKRKKVVRAGPRGFGQKIVEEDDNDDD